MDDRRSRRHAPGGCAGARHARRTGRPDDPAEPRHGAPLDPARDHPRDRAGEPACERGHGRRHRPRRTAPRHRPGRDRPPRDAEEVIARLAELRDALDVRVMVGALGPRMRRRGVTRADGVVLNWLTPEAAAAARADRDRDDPRGGSELVLYVRTGLPGAHERVRAEAETYARIPTYAANFARYGYDAVDAAILADGPAAIRPALAAYDGIVDEVVLRAITPTDAFAEHLELIRALG